MKKKFVFRLLILGELLALTSLYYPSSAQSNPAEIENQKLKGTIIHLDSLFWKAYNECDTSNYDRFFTDDVKFYHDKGGITDGKIALIASIRNNVCGNKNQRIRREAVDGTVEVYPMRKGNIIYGTIISGEHYFYVTETGKPEKREGLARFSQLWILNQSEWKMAVILSYDHGPASHINKRMK